MCNIRLDDTLKKELYLLLPKCMQSTCVQSLIEALFTLVYATCLQQHTSNAYTYIQQYMHTCTHIQKCSQIHSSALLIQVIMTLKHVRTSLSVIVCVQGYPNRAAAKEIQWITPDTSVFSINCHLWHSTLSAHWAKCLYGSCPNLNPNEWREVSFFFWPCFSFSDLHTGVQFYLNLCLCLFFFEIPDDSKIK